MTTAKSILEDYLRSHGFDGLCHPDTECGCGLDDLIGPCEGAQQNCQPAYEVMDEEGDPVYIIFHKRPTQEDLDRKFTGMGWKVKEVEE